MNSQQYPGSQQQMPLQPNPRTLPTRPVYGMPSRQVLMQPQMSQQQPRYVIARPPQNTQTPPNSQQLHSSPPNVMQNVRHDGIVVSMPSGSQLYQQPQNSQMMHQMNQQRPNQMMQQQGTPPNSQNYNTSSPYYNHQPSTPQMHQRIQQGGVQRPLTPQQQQHSQSPIPRKNTPVMVKTNSSQNMGEGNGSQEQSQQNYIIQTSVPTSVYNVVQGSANQSQVNNEGNRQNNFQIRHPVTNRPLQFTTQSTNPQIVRYTYPAQGQPPPQVVIQQQPRMLRPSGEYRPQYIQVVRADSDLPSQQNYVVTSQPNVFYRTAPQQPNSAIRQALGHENSYQQSIQTSQPPVIIHSIDNSNTRLVFGIPSRQPSSDNYESKAYSQNVEENASEYGGEHPSQRNNFDDDASDEASPAKKAKLTPKSGKPIKSNKIRRAPVKSIGNKTIFTGDTSEYGNEEGVNGSMNGHFRPIITKEILEKTAKSISDTLTLEEDAKTGVMMYINNFVSQLIEETGRAANLRKSKQIQNKDVEFALRTKFNINSTNTTTAKFGK